MHNKRSSKINWHFPKLIVNIGKLLITSVLGLKYDPSNQELVKGQQEATNALILQLFNVDMPIDFLPSSDEQAESVPPPDFTEHENEINGSMQHNFESFLSQYTHAIDDNPVNFSSFNQSGFLEVESEITSEFQNEIGFKCDTPVYDNLDPTKLYYDQSLFDQLEQIECRDVVDENQNAIVSTNHLLMKIPEDLQFNPSFDSLPSILLPKTVLKKIDRASTGCDGVFLTVNASEVTEKVVMRPPLQVIQMIKIADEPSPVVHRIKRKRKQNFTTNREDGIEFVDDLVSPTKCKRYSKNDENDIIDVDDETFKWTEPLAAVFKKVSNSSGKAEDESKRCPGCKKIFKKLPHKCNKMKGSELVQSPFKDDSFEYAELSYD